MSYTEALKGESFPQNIKYTNASITSYNRNFSISYNIDSVEALPTIENKKFMINKDLILQETDITAIVSITNYDFLIT